MLALASVHLLKTCQIIGELLRSQLTRLRKCRYTTDVSHWIEGAEALGLVDAEKGLRLNKPQQNEQQQPRTPSVTGGGLHPFAPGVSETFPVSLARPFDNANFSKYRSDTKAIGIFCS